MCRREIFCSCSLVSRTRPSRRVGRRAVSARQTGKQAGGWQTGKQLHSPPYSRLLVEQNSEMPSFERRDEPHFRLRRISIRGYFILFLSSFRRRRRRRRISPFLIVGIVDAIVRVSVRSLVVVVVVILSGATSSSCVVNVAGGQERR